MKTFIAESTGGIYISLFQHPPLPLSTGLPGLQFVSKVLPLRHPTYRDSPLSAELRLQTIRVRLRGADLVRVDLIDRNTQPNNRQNKCAEQKTAKSRREVVVVVQRDGAQDI